MQFLGPLFYLSMHSHVEGWDTDPHRTELVTDFAKEQETDGLSVVVGQKNFILRCIAIRTWTILNRLWNVQKSIIKIVNNENGWNEKGWKRKCSTLCTLTVYEDHIRKQERNTADREIQSAPSGLKASVWKRSGFYKADGESGLDKSHAIRKLCHT